MKRVLAALSAAVLLGAGLLAAHCWQVRHWSAWQAFASVFVQADGRVIDRTASDRTTSEAQAYGLFFALVANDRTRFSQILGWTTDNLAAGDLKANLPAWLWGAKVGGAWGVTDANPASDADLWLAYTLIEAARLWSTPRYAETGKAMLEQIKLKETADIPGVGLMLIPAPQGFRAEDGSWRLNPSYLPEFQFAALAAADPQGPWQTIWQNHVKAMKTVMRTGVAPDWYAVSATGEIRADRSTAGVSSYDAIRVPLWAAMTAGRAGDGSARDNELMTLLKPLVGILARGDAPPEKLDSASTIGSGGAPIGFSAAVLPFLAVMDEDDAVRQRQRLRKNRVEGNLGRPPHYYDQALSLFGEGWYYKRFRFGPSGQLNPQWEKSCCDWLF